MKLAKRGYVVTLPFIFSCSRYVDATNCIDAVLWRFVLVSNRLRNSTDEEAADTIVSLLVLTVGRARLWF
jgi:hypothetical protein